MATSTKKCPACGMPQDQWPDPDGVEGKYCCEGCANGTGCTCGETAAAESGRKKAKR